MKIIQSFWTKPTRKRDLLNSSDRNKGGWSDRKYNYMSWALSCLQFRKFYGKVELVTDSAGYDLLIQKLQLPYTDVKIVLDDLNEYHTDLWALGKLYAYHIQDEPFIHVDGDVYIWEKFDPRLQNAALLAQNIEEGFAYYDNTYKNIAETFEFIPEELIRSKEKNQRIIAVNAGVIGGNDFGFFKEYGKRAFEFVDRNRSAFNDIDIGMFNVIFEQYLFHAMAEERGTKIEYLTRDINHAFDGLAELTGAPGKIKFVHTVGMYKKVKYVGDLVSWHLQCDHPEVFSRIQNLLRTHQI